jgi:hypothetical protein
MSKMVISKFLEPYPACEMNFSHCISECIFLVQISQILVIRLIPDLTINYLTSGCYISGYKEFQIFNLRGFVLHKLHLTNLTN